MRRSRKREIFLAGLFVVVALSTLILAVLLNVIGTAEISAMVSPSQASYRAHYGDEVNASFELVALPKTLCSAECSYRFVDTSEGRVLDNGTVLLKRGEAFPKNYSLSLSRRGEGQFVYNFEAACRNIGRFGCSSSYGPFVTSSFVTLNYDYTSEELELKGKLGQPLASYLGDVNRFYSGAQVAEARLAFAEETARIDSLAKGRSALNDNIQKLLIEAESFRTLWSQQEFALLADKFRNRTMPDKDLVLRLNSELNLLVDAYNQSLLQYETLLSGEPNASDDFAVAVEINDTFQQARLLEIANLVNQSAYSLFIRNYSDISQVLAEQQLLISDLDEAHAYSLSSFSDYADSQVNFSGEQDRICRVKGYCPAYGPRYYPPVTRTNISSLRSYACADAEDLQSTFYWGQVDYSTRVLDSMNISKNYSEAYPYLYSYLDMSGLLSRPEFIASLQELEFNLSLNKSLSPDPALRLAFNLSPSVAEFRKNHCDGLPDVPVNFGRQNLSFIDVQAANVSLQYVNFSLDTPYPVCCVLGECRPCCVFCRNDSQTFPVVFVHGRSFNSRNQPEFSASAFGPIQRELQKEGFVNAGVLYYESGNVSEGDWGLSGKPVLIAVTYYYDVVGYEPVRRPSQEITALAVRLRDLVEVVKRRTGRDKVVIVAHSMGGLVSRSYMSIFGDGSVAALIMLGTPNQGINSTESQICGFFGEEKECRDMEAGSFFMRKLAAGQPPGIPVYNIVGTGCRTVGEDGDGVVKASSAYLPFADNLYVSGNCSGVRMFHTGMLHPEEYPEVVELVKDILKQR